MLTTLKYILNKSRDQVFNNSHSHIRVFSSKGGTTASCRLLLYRLTCRGQTAAAHASVKLFTPRVTDLTLAFLVDRKFDTWEICYSLVYVVRWIDKEVMNEITVVPAPTSNPPELLNAFCLRQNKGNRVHVRLRHLTTRVGAQVSPLSRLLLSARSVLTKAVKPHTAFHTRSTRPPGLLQTISSLAFSCKFLRSCINLPALSVSKELVPFSFCFSRFEL